MGVPPSPSQGLEEHCFVGRLRGEWGAGLLTGACSEQVRGGAPGVGCVHGGAWLSSLAQLPPRPRLSSLGTRGSAAEEGGGSYAHAECEACFCLFLSGCPLSLQSDP